MRLSSELASEAPPRNAEAERERGEHRVSRLEQEGSYFRLWVDVPRAWRERHTSPAEYLTARFGQTRHRFLVIANAPHLSRDEGFELLVEPNTDLAPYLDALDDGSLVTVSAPEGPGFPVDVGRRSFLFASGSGIAGLRPVLQHWSANPAQRPDSVVLFYEESEGTPHVFRSELEEWEHAGWLESRLSFVNGSIGGGYLDDQLQESGLDGEGASALLCGSPSMIGAVTAELLRRGTLPEAIHTNI